MASAPHQPIDRWFEPALLFDREYPEGVTSALNLLPELHATLVAEVRALAPRRALEVGPGRVPVLAAAGVAEPCLLDVAPAFLAGLAPRAITADVRAIPFAAGAFDLVVAADVLTHVRAGDRPGALAEMARVAPAVMVFNPELGTPEVAGSASPPEPIVAFFEGARWRVDVRRFLAWNAPLASAAYHGEYPITLITARRG